MEEEQEDWIPSPVVQEVEAVATSELWQRPCLLVLPWRAEVAELERTLGGTMVGLEVGLWVKL